MTSRRQSEGSSQPIEEHFATTLSQIQQQSQDSSHSNQEQPETTFTPIEEHSLTPSTAGKYPSTGTSHLEPQGSTLTTIATELRLKIYKHLFQTSATHLLRRRDGISDENVLKKLAHTFDCNILFTCRKLYEEAHPVFYGTQTIHHSFTTGGLSRFERLDLERYVPEGAMPYFSDKLHLMVKLSMGLMLVNPEKTDAVLSKQIAKFAQHCPQLRVLTIHFLSGDLLADSATGNVLRQLHPRLDSLNIVALGRSPHEVIPRLRLSIADDKYWSNVCISHRLDRGWPKYHIRKSQWPCLTMPSMIQDYVHRACSQSSDFHHPLPKNDYIYIWACQNKVNEEVRLLSFAQS